MHEPVISLDLSHIFAQLYLNATSLHILKTILFSGSFFISFELIGGI